VAAVARDVVDGREVADKDEGEGEGQLRQMHAVAEGRLEEEGQGEEEEGPCSRSWGRRGRTGSSG
jgi:hypothetical protein